MPVSRQPSQRTKKVILIFNFILKKNGSGVVEKKPQ